MGLVVIIEPKSFSSNSGGASFNIEKKSNSRYMPFWLTPAVFALVPAKMEFIVLRADIQCFLPFLDLENLDSRALDLRAWEDFTVMGGV